DVTSDMTERFELEVDTTHAHGVWVHEVEENLVEHAATASH
ncbi:3-ketosteroid-9-alpha-hydroxylase, partial [Mycobacterium kansasii]